MWNEINQIETVGLKPCWTTWGGACTNVCASLRGRDRGPPRGHHGRCAHGATLYACHSPQPASGEGGAVQAAGQRSSLPPTGRRARAVSPARRDGGTAGDEGAPCCRPLAFPRLWSVAPLNPARRPPRRCARRRSPPPPSHDSRPPRARRPPCPRRGHVWCRRRG